MSTTASDTNNTYWLSTYGSRFGALSKTHLSLELSREKMTSNRCPLTESLKSLTGIANRAVFKLWSSSIGSSTPASSSSKLSMEAAMSFNVWGRLQPKASAKPASSSTSSGCGKYPTLWYYSTPCWTKKVVAPYILYPQVPYLKIWHPPEIPKWSYF